MFLCLSVKANVRVNIRVCVIVILSVCVCVCACEGEREREKERGRAFFFGEKSEHVPKIKQHPLKNYVSVCSTANMVIIKTRGKNTTATTKVTFTT